MLWFWWIYSGVAGVLMLFFALDTWFGMGKLASLDRPEWDAAPVSGPRVSVIVPARDEEAGVRACLESLLAQDYQDLEVIAVDDRSTDSTGAIMDELARANPRLRVVHVTDLPPDWLGKPHAMWKGAQAASGQWLLFTDGDVIFRADCIRRIELRGPRRARYTQIRVKRHQDGCSRICCLSLPCNRYDCRAVQSVHRQELARLGSDVHR